MYSSKGVMWNNTYRGVLRPSPLGITEYHKRIKVTWYTRSSIVQIPSKNHGIPSQEEFTGLKYTFRGIFQQSANVLLKKCYVPQYLQGCIAFFSLGYYRIPQRDRTSQRSQKPVDACGMLDFCLWSVQNFRTKTVRGGNFLKYNF